MVRPLGRDPFQSDDRDWPVDRVEALVAAGKAVPLQWTPSVVLDQGDEGTCVAAGTLGACDCDDENHVISKFANKDIDPFFDTIAGAGPRPDGGAEVREGLKAAKKAGYISAYSLLTSSTQIASWIEKHGPVVVGVDWFSAMDSPNAVGFVTVGGTVRGGHCLYMNGDVNGLDFVNSWGASWADHGHFYMTGSDFARLMNGDFEAWAVVQSAPAPTPTPCPVKAELQAIVKAIQNIIAGL